MLVRVRRRKAKLKPDYIFLGLGNPGSQYQHTRHNLGAWAVTWLAKHFHIPLKTYGYHSLMGMGKLFQKHVLFAFPQTYMNLSGKAAKALIQGFSLEPSQLIVFLDDFAIPIGTLRLRRRGSSGGHRGLEDVLAALGTEEIPRLRFGIGPLPEGVDPTQWVLEPFRFDERKKIDIMFPRLPAILEALLEDQCEKALQMANTLSIEGG